MKEKLEHIDGALFALWQISKKYDLKKAKKLFEAAIKTVTDILEENKSKIPDYSKITSLYQELVGYIGIAVPIVKSILDEVADKGLNKEVLGAERILKRYMTVLLNEIKYEAEKEKVTVA